MRQDQHAVRVGHVALVLLDPLAGDRSAQLGQQRRPEQLGERQGRDFREVLAQLFGALDVGEAGAEHVDQRAAGAAHRLEHLAQAAAAVVFDE